MKKRTIFNALMFLLILFLGYVLFVQIKEPIAFQREKTRREKAVIAKLIEIRKAQELYRGVTGHFAKSFDELKKGLEEGQFTVVQVNGDPDDPNNLEAITYDTTYLPAIDSVQKLGLVLDDIGFVPFGKGAQFELYADTVTYQSTLVDVVEVSVPYRVFMGEWADKRFKKYDEQYSPDKVIKFGDRNKPILTGSWE